MSDGLSIVIPFFNERDNIAPLSGRIAAAMSDWGPGSYEVLWVDDGSTDGSLEMSRSVADGLARTIRLESHRGQTRALRAGLEAARYDLIATLDADLQNDPADLPLMRRAWEAGAHFIQGWRVSRRDPWIRRSSSTIANAVRRM